MTKDRRLYARFDIGMDENPKIFMLSDAAFRALIESTLYCRRQLTDGFIDDRLVSKRWSIGVVEELSGNDPERPSWVKVDGGYQIHDFSEHQVTTADIKAKREAGRAGGLAKASKNVAPASKVLEQNASKPLAKTETETETRRKDLSSELDEFDQWYAGYPRKEAKDAAKKAFAKARKSASLSELLSGLSQYNEAVAGKERQFIALPATWLNAGRWQDEIPTTTKPANTSPWNKEFHK
ncbi:MAG: hypothetical protein ABWY20_11905 [Mycobacterium sp.]